MNKSINRWLKDLQLSKWEEEDEMNINQVFLESENKLRRKNYGNNTSNL